MESIEVGIMIELHYISTKVGRILLICIAVEHLQKAVCKLALEIQRIKSFTSTEDGYILFVCVRVSGSKHLDRAHIVT